MVTYPILLLVHERSFPDAGPEILAGDVLISLDVGLWPQDALLTLGAIVGTETISLQG